jgi:hypothetical protein
MTRTLPLMTVVLLAGVTSALAQVAPPADSQTGVARFDVSWTAAAQPADAQPGAAQAGASVAPVQTLRPARPAETLSIRPRGARRPAALVPLYVSFGAVQAADVLSTVSSLHAGGVEQNPAVGVFGRNTGAMLGFKAATTAGTIYAAEKMWKTNRVGAVVLMAVLNGVTAAVAAYNMQVARAARAR